MLQVAHKSNENLVWKNLVGWKNVVGWKNLFIKKLSGCKKNWLATFANCLAPLWEGKVFWMAISWLILGGCQYELLDGEIAFSTLASHKYENFKNVGFFDRLNKDVLGNLGVAP